MFYISSGFGNGMFTLREHSLIHTNYGIKEDDRYIKNLARDYDKAVIKARQFVDSMGKYAVLDEGKAWDLEKWGEAEKPNRWEAPVLSPKEIAKIEADKEAKEKAKAEAQAQRLEEKRLKQEAYDKAEPVPLTDKRIKFTGVIEKTYFTHNQWGGSTKMFFVDERGFKLNGTAIKETFLDDEGDEATQYVDNGVKVSFIAKVVPSDDDPKFGFIKRPNNVEVM